MPVTPNSIVTPQTPKANAVATHTANTTYTGAPPNAVALVTAGPNGARVTRIRSIPRGTVTATGMHLFLSMDGGTTKQLVDSVLISPHTIAATTAIPKTDWGYSDDNPLIMPANAILYVSLAVASAEGIVTEAEWADY